MKFTFNDIKQLAKRKHYMIGENILDPAFAISLVFCKETEFSEDQVLDLIQYFDNAKDCYYLISEFYKKEKEKFIKTKCFNAAEMCQADIDLIETKYL